MNTHESDTPGGGDTGQGYPEQSQPGMGIDAQDHAEDDVTPDHGAPAASAPQDGDAGQATGNPNAAGGEDAGSGGN